MTIIGHHSSALTIITFRLASKFELACHGYLPREWIACLSYQQARLQEHRLLETIATTPREKQRDIRSMFGNKKREIPQTVNEGNGEFKKKYQQGMTKLFNELDACAKEERVPQFAKVFRKDESVGGGGVDGNMSGMNR